MDATLGTQDFRDALRTLRKFVGRGTFPIAERVKVTTYSDGGTVALRRWNGDDATASLSATSGPIEDGSAIVNADALANALGKAKGLTRITTADGRLTVTTPNGTVSVAIEDSDDFPTERPDDYADFATITVSELPRVRSVVGAAAKGAHSRAVLESVAISANGDGTGEAIATDTYRLHVARLARVYGPAERLIILPTSTFGPATKVASNFVLIETADDDRYYRLSFLTEKGPKSARRTTFYTVAGIAQEGPYPNYRALIPSKDDAPTSWIIRDAAGTASVLSAFSNRENAPAMLAPNGSAVAISAKYRDGTVRDAVAPIASTSDRVGTDDAIAINPDYFADAAEHVGDGAVVYLRDALRAALIEGDDAYALVMPMRIS